MVLKTLEAKIIHYGHSSVAVETPNNFLIFDYYYDNPLSQKDNNDSNFLSYENLKTDKDVYVFVSHSHGDHFNKEIFKWQDINPNIKYILSQDIQDFVYDSKYYYMKEYEKLDLGDIHIKTYGTTDRGVSFLINTDNIYIFHAGDLNWWHWKHFTKEEQKREEVDFKREIGHIIGEKIDIAFIPVDPRLEEYYHLAGEYIADKLEPKFLIPIHFREQFSICRKFFNVVRNLPIKVPLFTHIGDYTYV